MVRTRGCGRRDSDTMRLDLGLDDKVSYAALKAQLNAGKTASQIIAALKLKDASELAHWCDWHDLPCPKLAKAAAPPAPAPVPARPPAKPTPPARVAAITAVTATPTAPAKVEGAAARQTKCVEARAKAGARREARDAARQALDVKVAALHEAGMSGYGIARELKMHSRSIYRSLERSGLETGETMQEKREKVLKHLDAMIAKFNAGWSIDKIAAHHKLASRTCRRVLNDHGIVTHRQVKRREAQSRKVEPTARQITQAKRRERRRHLENACIFAMLQIHATVDEMSRVLGKTPRAIERIVKRAKG